MAKDNDVVLTPMMKQYFDLKAKHPDAVMLFRCGDFYETYSEDAVTASEILGITLTKRANGQGKTVEMAGFPHHALDTYLPKLIRAGRRVAICDQLEDPKTTKKLVKEVSPNWSLRVLPSAIMCYRIRKTTSWLPYTSARQLAESLSWIFRRESFLPLKGLSTISTSY